MKIVDIKYNLAHYRNYFDSILRDAKSFLEELLKQKIIKIFL